MIDCSTDISAAELEPGIQHLFRLATAKTASISASPTLQGKTPVFTVEGQYVAQGWTEWTQGFQFGNAILCFDATGDEAMLELGRTSTIEKMVTHVSHFGVHDHGFNNVSTYGNLRLLMLEGAIPTDARELQLYETALKLSGAVQANRWSDTADGEGYIYSFNGPHSLFCDTIRSLRSLALAHHLGHQALEENDERVNLYQRLIDHAATTAKYNVYYGEDRDGYDVRGRVAHESIFNVNDGEYRCPSTQQGYSPFTTWTRGLAWIMLGYPEQLEFLATIEDEELEDFGGREACNSMMLDAARAACDFYIDNTPTDGIPYWDTGAPGLPHLGNYLAKPAAPFNEHEPVDSSAAAIAGQGLLRLSQLLAEEDQESSQKYLRAGMRVTKTLLDEPYLSTDETHQGILLHSVYHRPKGWDHIPEGQKVPNGESCMWGDYHLLELGNYVLRLHNEKPYYTFWGS